MTAHTYLLAHFPEDRADALRPVDPALAQQALTFADKWAFVIAFSRRHALRLYRDGCEAVRGTDGRLERCGVVNLHRGGRP